MSTKLFVGSLPSSFNNEKLKQTFEKHGAVLTAKVMMDHTSKKSRGFGFVEMENTSDAYEAVKALNDLNIEGKSIIVNETR
ncbi:MAG: RNA-binding protein [Ignavibacteriales bacterium]|nr:RNA-binding protein [Ignavibacteriales bacterium]MBP9119680.1 RNA-binding protein [Ignavibacterium sp.]